MKRLLDVFLAAIAIFALWPLFLGLAVLVWLFLGSPVLFRQERPGLHGRAFTMYKFRSMRDVVDVSGIPLPDDQRLTRFGRWLRSSSLDELPELWNVLRGEMSLVGPRPLLVEYLPLYSAAHARRHEVRPGLTGWAQVNGRNAVSWEDRLDMDVWYVDHRSFGLDLKIMCITVWSVFAQQGVRHVGHATMPRYDSRKDAGDA